MSKIKEVLRLSMLSKLSSRQVETLTGTSQSSVLEYCSRFRKTSLTIETILAYDNDKITLNASNVTNQLLIMILTI